MLTESAQNPPDKVSYLLHVWREKNGPVLVWRASVTVVMEGRRQGFSHPEAALHLLAATLRELQHDPPAKE